MKTMSVWISYDLGITGDYNGLFQWLDTHKGIECVNNTALIKEFSYKEDFFSELRTDLEKYIKLERSDRIYVIYKDNDDRIKGKFLVGNRKMAPWTGYAMLEEMTEDLV